jgi:GxxExxY protein
VKNKIKTNNMTENEISKIILDISFDIHTKLGPGLFESVYEEILVYELENYGLNIKRQKAIPVIWEELKMEVGFRADIIVEDKVIIEIKSIETLAPIHYKQLTTYLKITGLKLGLLINFNEYLLKDGIKRIANKL